MGVWGGKSASFRVRETRVQFPVVVLCDGDKWCWVSELQKTHLQKRIMCLAEPWKWILCDTDETPFPLFGSLQVSRNWFPNPLLPWDVSMELAAAMFREQPSPPCHDETETKQEKNQFPGGRVSLSKARSSQQVNFSRTAELDWGLCLPKGLLT